MSKHNGELNGDFILRFLRYRNKKFTKTEIAKKYLLVAESHLSKFPIAYDPDDWFKRLFDLENEKSALFREDESNLYNALKVFISKKEHKPAFDVLSNIWDKGYKDFTIEMLKLGRPYGYTESQNEEVKALNFQEVKDFVTDDIQGEHSNTPIGNVIVNNELCKSPEPPDIQKDKNDNAENSEYSPEQTKTMQPPVLSEPIEFDEKFDLSAKKLREAFEKFQQEYRECDNPDEFIFVSQLEESFEKFWPKHHECDNLDESFFNSLFAALERTVGAGKFQIAKGEDSTLLPGGYTDSGDCE